LQQKTVYNGNHKVIVSTNWSSFNTSGTTTSRTYSSLVAMVLYSSLHKNPMAKKLII
jgi:hypothetical protein